MAEEILGKERLRGRSITGSLAPIKAPRLAETRAGLVPECGPKVVFDQGKTNGTFAGSQSSGIYIDIQALRGPAARRRMGPLMASAAR